MSGAIVMTLLAATATPTAGAALSASAAATGVRCSAAGAALGMPIGPLSVAFEQGELARPRRACPRTEVTLSGGGLLVADFANFYGDILAAGSIGGSAVVANDVEVFGSIEIVRYEALLSSFNASAFGLGHTSIGAAWRAASTDRSDLSLHVRATLPTATSLYVHARPFGADLGASALHRASDAFLLHASAGFLGSFAAGSPDPNLRAGVALSAGASWLASEAFSLVAELRSQSFYDFALDYFAAGLGARGRVGERLGVELALFSPIAGEDRALVFGALSVSWRLD